MKAQYWVTIPFRFLLCSLVVIFLSHTVVYAKASHVAPKKVAGVRPIILDDFEDANLSDGPKWFLFGGLSAGIKQNDLTEFMHLGVNSFHLYGNTSSWYVGGVGAYLGVDASPYKFMKLLVRGSGPSSGSLQVELYDDDNQNMALERNSSATSQTLFDDKFIYTMDVTWTGWRVVIIPLSNFRDENAQGDGVLNLDRANGSGGLLQLQFVAFANQEKGKVDFLMDSIRLY